MRIIDGSGPNQYMALLKFRSLDHADEFYKEYNGKRGALLIIFNVYREEEKAG